MRKILSVALSVAALTGFAPLSEAASPCPPEVAQAKELLKTKTASAKDAQAPRSLAGARTWDAMETLLSTARKLGVNFFPYIRDRVSGARQMPSLADLIKQRAETMDLGSSWKPI